MRLPQQLYTQQFEPTKYIVWLLHIWTGSWLACCRDMKLSSVMAVLSFTHVHNLVYERAATSSPDGGQLRCSAAVIGRRLLSCTAIMLLLYYDAGMYALVPCCIPSNYIGSACRLSDVD
jgi:hypothetical protein